jgi:hypothetical protein
MSNRIECLHRPSKEQLSDASSGYTKPVVVKGGMKDWRALSAWTLDSFRQRFGHIVINASASSNGIFTGDPDKGFVNLLEQMRFDRFLDLITGKVGSDKKYYFQQFPFSGEFANLLEDISTPTYIDKASIVATNLWLGPRGSISPLHYDIAANFFCQVSGAKRMVLFPPDQTAYLYPFPATSQIPHMSQVDINNLDRSKFPDFTKATATDALIGPGDILLLPAQWWHQVHSLSMCMSVNFWYK